MSRIVSHRLILRGLVVPGLILTIMIVTGVQYAVGDTAVGRDQTSEQFLTLGAGPAADARFGLGGLIANSLSAPLKGPDCAHGGPCGVPGLMVAARSYEGSPATIRGLLSGNVDLALVRVDVALEAVQRRGEFSTLNGTEHLVGLARLYDEAVILLVPENSSLTSVGELRGKRLAILAPRGGPNWRLAENILAAHGLDSKSVTLIPASHDDLRFMLSDGRADAVFLVDLPPAPVLDTLENVRFLPLEDRARGALRQWAAWLRPMVLLPDQNHRTRTPVLTLGIPVMLVARRICPLH